MKNLNIGFPHVVKIPFEPTKVAFLEIFTKVRIFYLVWMGPLSITSSSNTFTYTLSLSPLFTFINFNVPPWNVRSVSVLVRSIISRSQRMKIPILIWRKTTVSATATLPTLSDPLVSRGLGESVEMSGIDKVPPAFEFLSTTKRRPFFDWLLLRYLSLR